MTGPELVGGILADSRAAMSFREMVFTAPAPAGRGTALPEASALPVTASVIDGDGVSEEVVVVVAVAVDAVSTVVAGGVAGLEILPSEPGSGSATSAVEISAMTLSEIVAPPLISEFSAAGDAAPGPELGRAVDSDILGDTGSEVAALSGGA